MDVGARAEDGVRYHHPQAATGMMIPTWKLYENPYYIIPGSNDDARGAEVGNINMDGGSYSGVCAFGKFVMELMEPELEGLRSRVDHERKARKRAERTSERLSRELVEERGAREALERMCERLAKEVRDEREARERLRAEIGEERRMLRVAEVLREERVQMKLAEARAALEDRIGKLEGKVNGSLEEEETATAVTGRDKDKVLGEKNWDHGRNTGNGREIELSVGDHGQGKGTGRRPSPEAANPHIARGIKGFVEFPRGIRGLGSRSGNGGSCGPGKVEYHRAQIRILLKQAGSPVKSD